MELQIGNPADSRQDEGGNRHGRRKPTTIPSAIRSHIHCSVGHAVTPGRLKPLRSPWRKSFAPLVYLTIEHKRSIKKC